MSLSRFPFLLLLLLAGCSPAPEVGKTGPASPAPESNNPAEALAGSVRAGMNVKGDLMLNGIRRAIDSFQQEEGRLPANLEDLVSKKYMTILPSPPPGHRFVYQPQNGQVDLVPESAGGESQ